MPGGGVYSDFLRQIKDVHDHLQWWSRDFTYVDTVGVDNPYPGLIDVRRHNAADGATVLLVDNYQNISGLSVSFSGREYAVDASMISAIET